MSVFKFLTAAANQPGAWMRQPQRGNAGRILFTAFMVVLTMCAAPGRAAADTTPPTVSLTEVAGPPQQVFFTFQDTGSGLSSIIVTHSQNADTVVPPFTPGTTDPVVVTSTKIDQSQPIYIRIEARDVADNLLVATYPRLVVTNTNGSGAGSLREAILTANALSSDDAITFDPTVFATRQTITLGGTQLTLANSGTLSITGPNAGVVISGNNASRVFNVGTNADVTLAKLTISNGRLAGGADENYGGGIFNQGGTVTLINSTVSNNSASGLGNNNGGGIYNDIGAVTLINSTVSGNSASGLGNNYGGGIYNSLGTVTLTNSTVSGNSASGGSFFNQGGGIYNVGTANISNTIVAGNTATNGPDAFTTISISSQGYNLVGKTDDSSGWNNTTDQTGTVANPLDAKLGPLQDNGGPTQTLLPASDSPAVNNGDTTLTEDQRGVPRPQGNADDIGAVEYSPPPTGPGYIVTVTEDLDDGHYAADDISLREAIKFANTDGTNSAITFDPTVFATQQIITLGGTQLTVADNGKLTITGPAAGVVIDADQKSRVFSVNSGADVTLDGLSITGGQVSGNGGTNQGGGILNNGTLNLTNSTFSANSSSGSSSENQGGGVYNNGTVNLTNSTLSGNSSSGNGGINKGGGIFNNSGATLAITNSTFSGNSMSGGGTSNNQGSGIFNSGVLTITNSTFSGNSSSGNISHGGGIFNSSGASLTITNSTLSGNSSSGNGSSGGGGIFNNGTVNLTNSTLSANSSSGSSINNGGGIFNGGTLNLTNSTLSGNFVSGGSTSNEGGGIRNLGTLTITNSTLSGNSISGGNTSRNEGGGVYNAGSGTLNLTNSTLSGNSISGGSGSTNQGGGIYNSSTLNAGNTIIAGNTATNGPDVQGTLTSQGYNLIGNTGNTTIGGDTTGNILNQNAKLGVLQNNGGPTQTHLPESDSPAINNGDTTLTEDQRGVPRPQPANGADDIGAVEVSTPPAGPNFVVTVTEDLDDGHYAADDISLREAIKFANTDGTNSAITFDPTVFAAKETIKLGGTQLTIANNGTLSITGPDAGVVIDADQKSRVFSVNSGADVTLDGLSITGGKLSGNFVDIYGGGIYNDNATLALTGCIVSGNSLTSADDGRLYGGGIYNAASGSLTLTRCTVAGNSAGNSSSDGGRGGGIFSAGALTITGSTFAGNSATTKPAGDPATGGAIDAGGTTTISNSTFSGNSAKSGGGAIFYELGTMSLDSCTISGNSAGNGAGIAQSSSVSNPIVCRNTIIAGNTGQNQNFPEVLAVFDSQGYNLVGKRDGSTGFTQPTDQTGTVANPLDAKLNALADNGGTTQTHLPKPDSPAINKGDTTLTADQRGISRPQPAGGEDDIGAVEVEVTNSAPTVSDIAKIASEDTALTFAATDFDAGFSDPDDDPLATILITSLPTNGVLELYGVEVEVDDEIERADIEALTYTPDPHFHATDAFGYNASDGLAYAATAASVNITVNEVNDDPVFDPTSIEIFGDEGQLITFFAAATDVDTGTVLQYSLVGAPSGATINATTGEFKWTPTELQGPGTYVFHIKASDGEGGETLQSVTIHVAEVNQPPVLDLGGNRSVVGGVPFSFRFNVSDADRPSTGLSVNLANNNPSWVHLNSTPAYFGTPPVSLSPYTADVTVIAEDGHGARTQSTVRLTVTPPPVAWFVTPTWNSSEGTLTYVLKNNRSQAITGVWVTGTLLVPLKSVTRSVGTVKTQAQSGGKTGLTWNGFNLAAGQQATLTIKVTRPAVWGPVANTLYCAFGPGSNPTLTTADVFAP